jgi:colanic acid biosynthesis glycosyl transferase WcaI
VADLVMPSKLGGILACGGALIATANPDTEVANVANDAGGIVCLPEDTEQLADKISFLAQNLGDRQTMKIQARNYAIENLSKSQILNNLHSNLLSLGKKDI